MKYFILFSIIIMGCSSPNQKNYNEDETYRTIDSVIGKNQKNLLILDSTSKRTDSTITGKVEKTIKQISTLKEENTKLKKENESLKEMLDDASDNGKPFELLPVSNGKGNK